MENGNTYIGLEKELAPLKPTLDKAITTILDQEVTDYPIFVLHQKDTIELGVLLVKGGNIYSKWSVNASSLEEFSAKRIIEDSRIPDFQKVFKDPQSHFCLFVIEDASAKFVFLPR